MLPQTNIQVTKINSTDQVKAWCSPVKKTVLVYRLQWSSNSGDYQYGIEIQFLLTLYITQHKVSTWIPFHSIHISRGNNCSNLIFCILWGYNFRQVVNLRTLTIGEQVGVRWVSMNTCDDIWWCMKRWNEPDFTMNYRSPSTLSLPKHNTARNTIRH